VIGYTLRRLGYGLVVMALVTVFVFVVMRLVPGDAVALQLQETGASPEEAAAMRAQFGLDDPVWAQLGAWLAGAVQGDLGTSFYGGEPVTELFLARVPVTLQLGLLAIAIGALLGIGFGIVAAVTRGTAVDAAVRLCA
jgi:peptide/nickel transport system permease protein